MHILHVIHSIDPRSGGPSNALRGMIAAQRDAGHEITLVATNAQSAEPWAPNAEFIGRMNGDPAFANVNLVLGRAWGRRRPWSRFSYCPHTVGLLRSHLADGTRRPHVVHIHGAFSHLTVRAAQLARRYGIPYVIRPAGSFDAACLRKGMAFWKRLFINCFHRRDLRQAGAVHVTSQAEADELAQLVSGCRCELIPHGVCLPQGDLAQLRKRFLEAHPELAGRRLLLFLSRLHEKKRPGWMLDALAALGNEFADVAVVFVGPDGGQRAQLKERAKKLGLGHRAFHVDFLTGDDKVGAFAAAEMFCLPSQDENFGVAVIEAMAHGVPVVVTPGVASHVYVDAAECGLTVGNSVESLAQGIRQVLQSDRAELGRRGRQYVEEHLTWPAIAEQIDQLYRGILNGSGR